MTARTFSTVTTPSAPRRDFTRFVAFTVGLGAGASALAAGIAHLCAGVSGALLAYLGAA